MHFRHFIQKQLLFIPFFVCAALQSHAQTTTEEAPSAKKILDPKDRIVVDFSYDGFTHLPNGISQKAYSFGGNVYFMYDYPVGYGPFSLAFGGGFSTHD